MTQECLKEYVVYFFNPHLRICLLISEREEERDRGRETNIVVREKHQLVASHMGLTRDQTHNPLEGTTLQPSEPLGQGNMWFILKGK